MKLFGRTGGYYMFWTGAIYFAVGTYCVFVEPFVSVVIAQMIWILTLSLPFVIPPFGRWLNMSIDWDKNMFNWFGNKDVPGDEAKGNVYNLPKLAAVPEVAPPKKEEPAKIFYRLGLTDNNRVAFSMGYSEITMSHSGCQQMIDQLVFFQSQLYDEDGGNPNDDPDGGEPVPVPEQKAA